MAVGCVVSAVIGTLVVSAVYLIVASPSHCVGTRALGYCTYSISPLWYVVGAAGAVALFLGLTRVVLATAKLFRHLLTGGSLSAELPANDHR